MSDVEPGQRYEVRPEWVHIRYSERTDFQSVYGFAGSSDMVNLEGIRYVPKGVPPRTLIIYMHPATTLQLLPAPRGMAEHGMHVLCAGSRYARNDSALIYENVAMDLGAYVRHAREVWGYKHVVMGGWSGGGALALFYQAQAERRTVFETPAGDPCALGQADLLPVDAVILQAASISRALNLVEWIDPSVRDESDPDIRDPSLDLYDPANKPPYTQEFLSRFREAQLARVRGRTEWVKDTLELLKKRGGKELERGFVTHRTLAEPRFLDGTIDPNDRAIGRCWIGDPETANSGPVGIARFSTLRSWLSQWSIDDTNVDGERCAASIHVPVIVIEHTADDAVPQPHAQRLYDACGSSDKTLTSIKGANHYFINQPELLSEGCQICINWLDSRRLL